jgi:uncharacterized protein (TIGR00159 family)
MNNFLATVLLLDNFTRNFYIADFIDVIIIALFLYSAILLFKQTRSYLPLIGIGILIVVYSISQVFHLFLTSLALQSFFSAFFVVLVVIFQDELRRFFEFIAAWSTRQKAEKPIAIASAALNELVQAVAHMAHQRIGALIVLSGQENIERHIEGGKELDGLLSEELILSIFDATSPGHDGAMVIQKNRIVKFGAHLPLSNNFKEIGKHGTRHSATLGLAERSDAFIIVVSEEQGTVSIGYNGKLKTLKNIDDLEKELARFLKEKFPEETYKSWEAMLKKNAPEKIIALVGAGLLWFFVAYPSEIIQRDFTLPVTYQNVPDQILIGSVAPKEITVTLAGRGANAFETATPEDLSLAIEGASFKNGSNVISLDAGMVHRPLNLGVMKIKPQQVQVQATEYARHMVAVNVPTKGKTPFGTVIDSLRAEPATVAILVPKNIPAPEHIQTEVITLTDIKNSTRLIAKLVIPSGMYLSPRSPAEVGVEITLRKK